MNCEQAQDLITGLVDNQLSADERTDVESHLRDCRACQAAHTVEVAVKNKVVAAAETVHAPAGFAQNLSTLLAYATKQPTHELSARWWNTTFFRFAFAALLLITFAVPFFYFSRESERSLAPALFQIDREAVAGQIAPIEVTAHDDLVERLTEAVGGRFKPMGYDFSSIKLKAVSGMVGEIGGRKALIVVYRGGSAELTCITFPGSEDDAPRDAKLFFDPEKNINFHMFSSAGLNAVMHREGDLICVIISKLPMDELLTLVRSQARHS